MMKMMRITRSNCFSDYEERDGFVRSRYVEGDECRTVMDANACSDDAMT